MAVSCQMHYVCSSRWSLPSARISAAPPSIPSGGSQIRNVSQVSLALWIIVCVHVSEQVCYHMGSETEPDERDKQTDRGDIDILMRYITRCLPGLVPVPAVVESCMYTVSDFIACPQVPSLICHCVPQTKLSFSLKERRRIPYLNAWLIFYFDMPFD